MNLHVKLIKVSHQFQGYVANRPKRLMQEEVLHEGKMRSWLVLAVVGNLEPCAQLLLQRLVLALCTQPRTLQPT